MNAADMAVYSALKNAHESLIAEDRVNVVIRRTQLVSNGAGGSKPQVTDLPAFTGRLETSTSVKQRRDVKGGSVELVAWSLYAPAEADLQKTPAITDRFTLTDGRTFEVALVKPLSYKATTYGYQAEVIEAV